jgi:PKD repeat protein
MNNTIIAFLTLFTILNVQPSGLFAQDKQSGKQIRLRNRNLSNQSVNQNPCPQIQYTKSASPSGNFDTLIIQNQTTGVLNTAIDYCAGDLEQTPVLQSQQTGTPPISNASHIIPVWTGTNWTGFIPAPVASNSTCFFKADFGSDFNNDISNFSTSLGTLQNRFPTPDFIRIIKKDSIWYAFASNGDTKLWRIRFGQSLDNNSPEITQVQVPATALVNPVGAQLAVQGDSTYLFILNNNNQVNNNVVRLLFRDSLESEPQVTVLNNPLVLQNSNGFFQMSFGNDCGNWFGLLLANSQLYRLDYGNSLNRTPTAVALTGSITAGLSSPNSFNNLRGVSLLQDLGKWYAFINTSNGSLIRVRFGNGLGQNPDQVTALGNFGIAGTVSQFQYLRQNSEFFGIVINNTGTVYKLKFPNYCPASRQYKVMNSPGSDSTRYLESGKYFFTLTSVSPNGTRTQIVDSVSVALSAGGLSCKEASLIHPDKICFDYSLNPDAAGGPYINSRWDFCTGDFKLPPTKLALPSATGIANISGHQVVEANGNFYAFSSNASGLFRQNLGPDPAGTPAQPVTVVLPAGGTAFSTFSDFRIYRENGLWFALCIYQNGEAMVRLNFGADITNNNPGFAILNLPGFLSKPRGIDLFEDAGSRMAVISNQNSGSITLLNFGSTYRNIPFPLNVDIPGSISLMKISMVRDCRIWHAFVSDLVQDSVFHLRFSNGLQKPPQMSMLSVLYAGGVKAVKDGNEFFLFVSKTQTGRNNLYRFSFGKSLDNEPQTDSLGNFPGTTPNSGLTKVNAFHLYQTDKSQYYFFCAGEAGSLYRLAFQNPCSADKPIASTQLVENQVYRADGKFYFSYEASDEAGTPVSGFDSVNVQNLVDADFVIPGNRCKGEPIQFNDASITGIFTSITNWNWYFGDSLSGNADSSILPNPVHTYTSAGNYTVRLRVREQGGCINEIVRSIVIADKPKPDFVAGNGGPLCTNDSIQFTDLSLSLNEAITSREWEIRKNGVLYASSSRTNPRFFFTETGNYEVRLRVKGESQCDSLLIRNIEVGSQGILVSYTNPSACLGEQVVFVPSLTGPSPDSVKWFVDTEPYNTTGNFLYTFTSSSVFAVKLVAYSGQCANSFTKIIKVNTRPSFSIDVQAALFCQGLPLNFSSSLDASQPVKYLWNFGDGSSDTVKAPVKSFLNSGIFQVILKVSAENGCFSEDSLSVETKRAPTALFSFDKACKDEPVTFTNLSTANGIPGGITSYFWEFGTIDNQTSDQQNPGPVFYNEPPGNKIVRLTVRTAEECPNTYTRTIAIGPKIAANFRKESGCIGTPFRFFDETESGTDSIVKWEWSIGGLNYNTRNPVVQFDLKGTYDVRLFVKSSSGCTDEVIRSQDVTVLDAAEADFSISGSTFSEPPFQVLFRQLPDVNPSYSYFWDFGDSSTSISPNPPPHFYTKEGSYIITMTATRSGTICSTTVQKVVNVVTNPLQEVKVRKIIAAKGNENIAIAVEIENQSNIALKSINLFLKSGNLTTIREKWNGILLPGAVIQYDFKSGIQYRSSQRIPYLCVEARLENPEKELSPDDNVQCLSLDSVSSLVGLYPNPAGPSATVDLSLVSGDPFELRIINSLGKEVYRLNEENPLPGRYARLINTAAWAGGLYHVWFRSGAVSESRKLLIVPD